MRSRTLVTRTFVRGPYTFAQSLIWPRICGSGSMQTLNFDQGGFMRTLSGLSLLGSLSMLLVAGCSTNPATDTSASAQVRLPPVVGDRLGTASGSCDRVALATNVHKLAEGGRIQLSAKASCNDDAPPEFRFEAFIKGVWVEIAPWGLASKTSFEANSVGNIVARVFVRSRGQVTAEAYATADVNVVHSAWLAIDGGLGAGSVVALASDPSNPQIRYAGTTDGVYV